MIVKSDFVKVFHFVAALQFFYGIYYECFHVLPEELKLRKFSFGGKFIYLTFLDAVNFCCLKIEVSVQTGFFSRSSMQVTTRLR